MKRGGLISLMLVAITTVFILSACGSSGGGSENGTALSLEPASTEYPNAGLLISATSLQNSMGARDLVIIDARTSGYSSGHIPGAINLIHGSFWTRGTGLKSVAELQSLLGASGLTRDKTYVIYDNTSASWGAAGRIFWMLEYLGCLKVHILNGGWDKWMADGRPTETTTRTLPAATFTASVNSPIRSTKESILGRMADGDFVVVDARTDEEYMGWQLYGEARGGHIPGAVQIPYVWFYNSDKTVLSYTDLKTLFESRGITSDKEVTSHCTVGIRSGFVYFALRLLGYPRASNYDASIVDWAAADGATYPMEKAANYWRVVHPQWVSALITGGTAPATFPSGNGYAIFECSWGATSSAYNAGHIPGAIHFDTNTIEARNYLDPDNPGVSDANEIVWDLVKDSLLQDRLRNVGINDDTTVIVYGSSAIAVARVYWALRYAGVDVRFLNGGYIAWLAGGGTADTVAHAPSATGNVTVHAQTQIKALTPEVYTYATYFRTHGSLPAGTVLVDVRTQAEYTGDVVGYDDPNITRKGRIPGAVWAHEADRPVYGDADKTLRSYTEIRDIWDSLGITSDKTLIFYCGTGWRSTLAFLYADLMGYPNIKNYDSWYVWGTYYELVDMVTGDGLIHRGAPYNDVNMPIDTGWPGS